jgi:hypothetical protein
VVFLVVSTTDRSLVARTTCGFAGFDNWPLGDWWLRQLAVLLVISRTRGFAGGFDNWWFRWFDNWSFRQRGLKPGQLSGWPVACLNNYFNNWRFRQLLQLLAVSTLEVSLVVSTTGVLTG